MRSPPRRHEGCALRKAAPLVVGAAVADWALKAGAVAMDLHLLFVDRERSWGFVLASAVIGLTLTGLIAYGHVSRVTALGGALILGGGLGSMGERIVLGHVTDFIPLPSRMLASPADLCLYAGFGTLVHVLLIVAVLEALDDLGETLGCHRVTVPGSMTPSGDLVRLRAIPELNILQ